MLPDPSQWEVELTAQTGGWPSWVLCVLELWLVGRNNWPLAYLEAWSWSFVRGTGSHHKRHCWVHVLPRVRGPVFHCKWQSGGLECASVMCQNYLLLWTPLSQLCQCQGCQDVPGPTLPYGGRNVTSTWKDDQGSNSGNIEPCVLL